MDRLDQLDDATAAAAFRRLVRHLRHRTDVQNIDLMGLSGFCRNCLGDWIAEAGDIDKGSARDTIYGMPQAEWKALHQREATPEQIARMDASMALNAGGEDAVFEELVVELDDPLEAALDEALDESFPTDDPAAAPELVTEPRGIEPRQGEPGERRAGLSEQG